MSDNLLLGGARLGAAFGAGHRIYETAKTAEEKRLIERAALQAETDRKVDMAVEEQQKRKARQAVEADTTMDPLTKQITLAMLGTQYAGAQRGAATGQNMDFRAEAVKQALAGDPNAANANMLGVASGPAKLTEVQGGQIIRDPYSTHGEVTPTDVSLALAGQHRSAAHLSDVKAAAGGFKPTAPGAAHGKRTEPTQGLLSAYFGRGDGTIDRGKVLGFETFRAQHPEITNGAEALDAYQQTITPGNLSSSHGSISFAPGAAPVVSAFAGDTPAPAPDGPLDYQSAVAMVEKLEQDNGAPFPPAQRKTLIHEMMTGGGGYEVTTPTHGAAPASAPSASPPPGARAAKDGKFYVPDPNRPGKYLQWVP